MEVKIWSLCSVSSIFSNANLTNKERGEYFSKEVFLSFLPVSSFLHLNCHCVVIIVSLWYGTWLYNTLPPASVASGWKVQEELPAWTPAGANSVFFKLTGMRDWCFSLWVTSKAKRGKHVNSLELIRFKSSLLWCVSFFGTFMSAFVLFQFSSWRMCTCFYAKHVHK